MEPDIVHLITTAIDRTGRIAFGIEPDRMTDPTPCADWDVGAVLNHVVGGMRIFAALVAGEPAPGAHEADWLGDDPAGAWAVAATADALAWRRPGALDGTIELSLGSLPVALAAWIHLSELVVHGIDLAVATDQLDLIDQTMAARLLAAMRVMNFEAFRVPASFGAALEAPAAATPHEELMAFLGRSVGPAR
jgi:uncharacterized protein (TIGR03086 family)